MFLPCEIWELLTLYWTAMFIVMCSVISKREDIFIEHFFFRPWVVTALKEVKANETDENLTGITRLWRLIEDLQVLSRKKAPVLLSYFSTVWEEIFDEKRNLQILPRKYQKKWKNSWGIITFLVGWSEWNEIWKIYSNEGNFYFFDSTLYSECPKAS